MTPILSKKFWIVSTASFVIFGISFLKIHNSYPQTANIVSAIESSSSKPDMDKNDDIIDTSKYSSIMPVKPGTKWVYEGKRIVYSSEQNKAVETNGQKIVEVKGVKKEGDNLRVLISVSYLNNPVDFDKYRESFVLSQSGFAFDDTNIAYFPLVKGQHLSPSDSDFERTDNYYVSYVYSVGVKNVFGQPHRCYDIVYDTLPDESLDTFCEGIGYIRNSYEHHGTPDEWDYNLIRIERP